MTDINIIEKKKVSYIDFGIQHDPTIKEKQSEKNYKIQDLQMKAKHFWEKKIHCYTNRNWSP